MKAIPPVVKAILEERYQQNLLLEDDGSPSQSKSSSARKKFEEELKAERQKIADERKKAGLLEPKEDVAEHQAMLSLLYKTPGHATVLSPEEYEKLTGSTSKPLFIEKTGPGSYIQSSQEKEKEEGKESTQKTIAPAHISYENAPWYSKTLQAAKEHLSDPEAIKQDLALGILTGGVGRLLGSGASAIATGLGGKAAAQTLAKGAVHAAMAGTAGYLTKKDIEAGAEAEQKGKAVGTLEKTAGVLAPALAIGAAGAKMTSPNIPGEAAGRMRAPAVPEVSAPKIKPDLVRAKPTKSFVDFLPQSLKKTIAAGTLATQLATQTPATAETLGLDLRAPTAAVEVIRSAEAAPKTIAEVKPTATGEHVKAKVQELTTKGTAEQAPAKAATETPAKVQEVAPKGTPEQAPATGVSVSATQAQAQTKQKAQEVAPKTTVDQTKIQQKQVEQQKQQDQQKQKEQQKQQEQQQQKQEKPVEKEVPKEEEKGKEKGKEKISEPKPPYVPLPLVSGGGSDTQYSVYSPSGRMTGADVGLAAQQLGRYSTLFRQR
jgi:hypothetical protein